MDEYTPKILCRKCRVLKPATSEFFYADNRRQNKYSSPCKSCRLAMCADYRIANPEKVSIIKKASEAKKPEKYKQIRRDWADKNHDKINQYAKDARIRYPQKAKARSAVNHAVRDGKLPQAESCICVDCGKQAQCYHHWSYIPENWLDVIPLCIECHMKAHVK